MYKMKLSFVLILVMISGIVAAQSLQEGKKFLYQQRFASAKATMEKVVAAAPTNPESIYWLAQVLFEMKDVNGAKEVLRKGMEGANGSNPLLLVAMGQAELVDKKPNDARQRFETAISLTKGKDVAIYMSDGGRMTAKMMAPIMKKYLLDSGQMVEFPNTINVDFYKDSAIVNSKLSANYAKYIQEENLFFLKNL